MFKFQCSVKIMILSIALLSQYQKLKLITINKTCRYSIKIMNILIDVQHLKKTKYHTRIFTITFFKRILHMRLRTI